MAETSMPSSQQPTPYMLFDRGAHADLAKSLAAIKAAVEAARVISSCGRWDTAGLQKVVELISDYVIDEIGLASDCLAVGLIEPPPI